ncbi:hypothetical protein ACFLVI_03950 [Chloroflexota bacterium]
MKGFDKYLEDYQTNWRVKHLSSQKLGRQNKKKYPWILPRRDWEQGLWAGIQSGSSHSLPFYLSKKHVQKHTGVHNLKSSWVLCANLYFPFQRDQGMLTGFLRENIISSIETVDGIELEYAEERPLDPTTLLGEPEGQRGKNQTSPDVAFIITMTNGHKGLILTESKFTEHSFYQCSGRNHKYDNPDAKRCMNFKALSRDFIGQCYMTQWAKGKRTNRKYWNYINFTNMAYQNLKRCPAAIAGYQLFRQQALGEAIALKSDYEEVISCVAYDERNETLIRSMRGAGIDDFTKDWDPLFDGKAKFVSFTHQQWVNWVSQNDTNNTWQDWLSFIRGRYGY